MNNIEIIIENPEQGIANYEPLKAAAQEMAAVYGSQLVSVDAIKDAIRAALGEREEVTAGAYKITYKPVTSTRIDSKALRRELPEMAECFTKTSTVRRLIIA